MACTPTRQRGFVLIVSLIFLVAITVLVVGGMKGSILGERMAGSHMDRTRAYQAAEQALRMGEAALQARADACVSGCTDTTARSGIGALSNAVPTAWPSSNTSIGVRDNTTTGANANQTKAEFLVNLLPDTLLPSSRAGCKAYSIMGRGSGRAAATAVLLQTVVFVCPL